MMLLYDVKVKMEQINMHNFFQKAPKFGVQISNENFKHVASLYCN